MPIISEITDPFDSSNDLVKTIVKSGTTPRQYLDQRYGEDFEFEHPTVLKVNSREVMRSEWDSLELVDDDTANFVRLSGDPLTILYIAIAASAAFVLLGDVPEFKEREDPPSVYNLTGQKNSIKLGNPIPVCYGRNKQFPPYAARSYNKFENNDQFLFSLFCIGQGVYDIEDILVEDTDIDNFSEVTYEIYEPGDQVTLFPDNVITSVEVSNIELFGQNQDDYTGESGPFVANDAGTDTDTLEWDVVFPSGLYRLNDDGGLEELTVDVDFSYREIDDDGLPIDSWVTVPFTKTLATDTPQRFTISTSVTAGRYEVKSVRTNDSDLSTRAQDRVNWYQLRAILPSTKDYGDVTLLAVKARASNNLNDSSKNRFNVICTRKIEQWNGVSWDSPVATRNPVWAFCDVIRSVYGANLGDSKLDLASLISLAAEYEIRSDHFDWVFDKKSTIWDSLKIIAEAGRASAVINGTKFDLIRDEEKTLPVASFAPENMVKGSFNWSLKLQPESDYDGIELEYLDQDTWKQETVQCLLGDDAGENTQKVTIPGITDRNKAYQHGLYVRAKQLLQREQIQLTTGQEGHIPIYGDLVAISHDSPEWGAASGFVSSIAGDNVTVTLDQSLKDVQGNMIAFRDKTGATDGPYQCSKVAGNDFQVVTTSAITGDFLFNSFDEPPIFFFGSASTIYKLGLVREKTSSSDNDTVSISLVNYDDRIYSYDAHTTTPLSGDKTPSAIPDIPTITGVDMSSQTDDNTLIIAVWDYADGSIYYIVEISYDNSTWTRVGTVSVNYISFNIQPGTVYIRVAGVNAGQGPWTYYNEQFGNDVRVTATGDTRVTSTGDRRVTSSPTT